MEKNNTIQNKFNLWLKKAVEDSDLKTELLSIKENDNEIYERFYRDLEFGTGGLRGVLGAGTNRLNVYTVRKATQGMADYLLKNGGEKSLAIAYDSRIKSDYFARNAASVLAANGIKVHIYKELMPTPMLSFAVRELNCDAGIIITASHNPSKYNGFKAYGPDGCQLTLEAADAVLEIIDSLDIFEDVKYVEFEKALNDGMISYIDDSVIDNYMTNVKAQSIHPEVVAQSGLKVVYTPLNGSGNKPVRHILNEIGVKDVVIVKEQENPDGNFPTCPYPNPESAEALKLGLELSREVKPDLLLATDPDCDRVGIAVPDGEGDFELISGNEMGALLLEYICTERIANGTMPKNPVTVKTIVTTDLIKAIAKEFNVELIEVLTGFKFIGEQITFLEEKGEKDRYIFGFEESYGYLAGTYVRDKDAVVASMLICEMAAFYRTKGISLLQARDNLYEKYGYYCNKLATFTCEGASGMERMSEIMSDIRTAYPIDVAGERVIGIADYLVSEKTDLETGEITEITLPKSNVFTLYLENNNSIIVRPSGTEPKIKVYYTAIGENFDEACALQEKFADEFTKVLGF